MRALPFAVAIAALSTPVLGQNDPSVDYRVTFENAVHHEAQITVSFQNIGEEPLELRMSRSSPGRYALHEFAKNVYSVSAIGSDGQPLEITRDNPYSWRIADHDGAATITYTLYADRADGTYSQIDETHAHLNMPATFMWAPGFEDRPITLSFEPLHRNWKAATQLPSTRGRMNFSAPNLQYFLDSPVELSNFDLREWTIGEGAERQTIRLAVHHEGEPDDVDILAEKTKKVVIEQIKVFGEAPDFDYGEYTFIADYLPHASRDGMEHRNSTILTRSQGLYEADFSQLGTISHEFFHAWNVERLRPAELEPFDFFRANPTPSLWFAEGFTSYYGPLTIRRAGESTVEEYASDLGKRLTSVINGPGRSYDAPIGMSQRAAFVDAARTVDPTNYRNTFVSYYSYGAMIGLALDLSLRENFEDISLDDYMRHLWRTHGVVEVPYTHEDLRQALADVTDDTSFATEFFANYIENGDLPDYTALLAQAGLKLQPAHEGDAYLGRPQFDDDADGLVISSNTLVDSPLYKAGINRGDQIMRIGRFRIKDKGDWERALKRHEPGDTVTIVSQQRDDVREADITFIENPMLEIVPFEDEDLDVTEAQKAFRNAWLGAETLDE